MNLFINLFTLFYGTFLSNKGPYTFRLPIRMLLTVKKFSENNKSNAGFEKRVVTNNSHNYTTFVFRKEIPSDVYGYDCRYIENHYSSKTQKSISNQKKNITIEPEIDENIKTPELHLEDGITLEVIEDSSGAFTKDSEVILKVFCNMKKMELLNSLKSNKLSEHEKMKIIQNNYYEIFQKTTVNGIMKDALYRGFEEFEDL